VYHKLFITICQDSAGQTEEEFCDLLKGQDSNRELLILNVNVTLTSWLNADVH